MVVGGFRSFHVLVTTFSECLSLFNWILAKIFLNFRSHEKICLSPLLQNSNKLPMEIT